MEHAISLLGTSIEIGRSRIEWLLSKADSYVETIMKFLPVNIVNTLTVRSGQIGILNEKIVFVASVDVEPVSHLAIEQYRLKKDKSIFKVWPLELVKEVLRRRYANRRRAVQLHFIHGKSLFLDFPNEDSSE